MVTGRSAPNGFAGRVSELKTLTEELNRARTGQLRVMLITGDPGIGKTALATEAATRAGDALVLSARAHRLGATTPFGLWIEALERHLRTLETGEVIRLAGPAARELAPLLRSVEASDPGQDPRKASSYRLMEDLVGLVAALAAETPLLLTFDDAHVADVESWETLHFLARDRPELPLLVIVLARTVDLGEHTIAPEVVLALEQEGILSRLRLGPMARPELAELTRLRTGRELVPDRLLVWLEERSRGNALFALGLLSALMDEGADLANPRLSTLPEDLSERALALVRDLDEVSRSTLELLAVLGSRVELADLARVAGRTMNTLAVALEHLERRRLVMADESGGSPAYAVTHPLIQDAIYQSIGAGRRRGMHRSIGRTLVASGRLEVGAAHLARSADRGDTEAANALIGSLRQAEARSLYRAVTAILTELVELLPEGDDRWLRVLDAMEPRAQWVLAHLAEDHAAEAYEAMRRIEQLVEAEGDDRRRGIVQLRMACFGGVPTGRLADALSRCDRAAELLAQAGDGGLASAAEAESAYVRAMGGDHLAGMEVARGVLAGAPRVGDELARMHALTYLGWTLPYVGAFEEALEYQRQAARLAQQTGNHYRSALTRHQRWIALAYMGRVAEANALVAEGSRGGPAVVDALLHESSILVHWLTGDLEAAQVATAKAVARNRTAVSVRQAAYLAMGARAAIDADRLDGVEDLIGRTQRANEGHASVWAVYPQWVAGVLAWRHQRPDAVDQLRAATQRIRDIGAPAEAMWFLLDLAEAAFDLGAADVAEHAAEQASMVLRAVEQFPLYVALSELIDALTIGDAAKAQSAGGVLAELGYRLFAGRALLAAGRASARTDRPAAVEAVEGALESFDACGADWHRRRALSTLRTLGSRGRRAAVAAAGPGSLTTREAEVVRLAAGGLTAREIAEALYIGERTVETHLANAYPKLGVRGKRELVQRAAELGIRT